jgi:hypothetical protein
MKKYLLLFAIVLVLSLTLGCGFATSTFQAATPTPSPAIIKVNLDETHASSAVISPDGGTITAQGADGTKFTLTFPKDALSNDETITLTPITAIDGLPFSGGLVGGAQMAPEGLRLFQPAFLTIESPKTVAATGFETVAFAYHQTGEGLYLNPSEVKGNILTLEIWHFSGAAAAQGTSAEIQTQQGRVPSNAEDAFTQRMRDILGRERQAQLLGQPTDLDLERTMSEFLREAYDRFIAPQLPMALQDCEAARPILSKALGWLRQVQLLGLGEQFSAENNKIMDTMSQAIVNCYNKEYDQCVIDKKIEHRTTMLGLLRQAALLGIDGQLDQSKIEKCPPTTSYKITATSQWSASYPNLTGNLVANLQGVMMEVNADGKYSGTAEVTWSMALYSSGCSHESTIPPSQAHLTGDLSGTGMLSINVTYDPVTMATTNCASSNTAQIQGPPIEIAVNKSGGTMTQAQTLQVGNMDFSGSSTIIVIPEDEAVSFNTNNHEASWNDFSSLFGVLLAWR